MNEKDMEFEDGQEINGKIPVNDKRRFNADGEAVPVADAPKTPEKSPAETALEAAKPEAIAASIALPPASSTATPASAALFACATTMPRLPEAAGFSSCQFWVTWGDGVKRIMTE